MNPYNYRMIESTGAPIKAWVKDVPIDDNAIEQIKKASQLPFVDGLAIMPDCHWGMGCAVGTVVATRGAIVPSMVGVDIGCGMMATRLPVKIDVFDDLPILRHSIERSIPVGFNKHKEPIISTGHFEILDDNRLSELIADEMFNKSLHQIGTLGGGNHFIELCFDQVGDAWVMLHSGSRHIGKELAEIYISKAKDLMKEYFINVPDPDLSYLVQGTQDFNDYVDCVQWAQQYAFINRKEMMNRILKDIYFHLEKKNIAGQFGDFFSVNCHHNYISRENHNGKNLFITRKGAVSARDREYGIIPGSMGAKSFIVQGKGNIHSYHSCSHGAGRVMGRKEAERKFTIDDAIKATEGVECRKDAGIIDEIPQAYKSIDAVMSSQADLVDIVFTLKQVLCIKG